MKTPEHKKSQEQRQ